MINLKLRDAVIIDFVVTEIGLKLGFSIEVNPCTERKEILINGVSIESLDTPLTIVDLKEHSIIALKH